MEASTGDGSPKRATTKLARTLLRVVRKHDGELGAGPLVLAVSGGPDSLAMLFAAATVRRALRRDLVVAHFSHGMRPRAERVEASLVRRAAARLGVPVAEEQGAVGGSESSAREARYAFLARVAREHGACAVATAHTLDDQAETVLLRLTRGAGLRGAGAMRELSSRSMGGQRMVLLRPLLAAARTETQKVCEEWGVEPASDGTNRLLRFARNRVRRHVLPDLAEINPDVRTALAAFADHAQADDDLLGQLARDAVAGVENRTSDRVTWRTGALSGLPAPLFARVLQDAWAFLWGEGSALTRAKVDTARRAVLGRGGTVDLGRGATLAVEQELTTMWRAAVAATGFAPIDLAIPGEATAGGWNVTARVATGSAEDAGPWRAMLDAAAIGRVACVRSRLAGDRFQPLGMANEVRLQDVLVNARVPRSQREGLPLLVGMRGIAWVPGVRIAEWAKVTPETTRAILIEVRPVS